MDLDRSISWWKSCLPGAPPDFRAYSTMTAGGLKRSASRRDSITAPVDMAREFK